MGSQLEGALKKKIALAFAGKLSKGILRRESNSTVDQFGDPVSGTPTTYTFEGIRQNFSLYYLAATGISQTDVNILILLGSLKPSVLPQQGDKAYIDKPFQKWHLIRRVLDIDPAGASMSIQATEIDAP